MLVPLALVGAVVIAGAAFATEPWTLFTDSVVDEALPAATGPAVPGGSPSSGPEPTASPTPNPPAEPVVLAAGAFISHEHSTSGAARVLELADGTRVLRFEGLDTSNGPDLRVWITDAPVIQGRDGWFVFDDGAYVDLGPLKGNKGSQNYVLPAGVDLETLTSVSIWCQRFRVSFGAAELA